MCSYFCTRVLRRDMPRGTAWSSSSSVMISAAARANGYLFAPPVDLISITLYGTGKRTQEAKLNRLRNRNFLNFCWVGPYVGPEA